MIVCSDVLDGLRSLEAESVQCCVTSPPYWGLRDYGTDGQIGLEATPEEYVSRLVGVFREVRRVLRLNGTLWLNLGDSYCSAPAGNAGQCEGISSKASETGARDKRHTGTALFIKTKDLIGIPWRVAFALQADGWWLRSDIIWAKPNPMPESVTDRPTKAHEYLFLLSKSARYYYDAEAIAEATEKPEYIGKPQASWGGKKPLGRAMGRPPSGNEATDADYIGQPTRNRRSVWTIPTEPFPEAHFAVMPTALVEPCVKAGSRPGDLVADPFCGSGTVGVVARRLGRRFWGCDLSEPYCAMARRRIENYHRERPPAIREALPLFDIPDHVGKTPEA